MEMMIQFAGDDNMESVTQNILLSSQIDNMKITWETSNPDIISEVGLVVRPKMKDERVILTAAVSKFFFTTQKQFELNVKKINDLDARDIHNNTVEDLKVLNLMSDTKFEMKYHNEKLVSITGIFSDVYVNSSETALISLYSVKTLLDINNPVDELVYSGSNDDEYGTQYTFSQIFKGIIVYGRKITICVDKEGKTCSLNSGFLSFSDSSINTIPLLDQNEGLNIIYSGLKKITHIKSTLCIFSLSEYELNPILAYSFMVTGINNAGKKIDKTIFIDANHGTIIKEFNNIIY